MSRRVAVGLAALLLVVTACARPAPEPSRLPVVTETPGTTPGAVASPRTDEGAGRPSIDWTEIDLDPAPFAGAIVGTVATGGPGFVAFGRLGERGVPVTWTSADGERWTRHEQRPWTFGGGVPEDVVQRAGGLVALGWGWGQDQAKRETWRSFDGVTWERSTSPARALGSGEHAELDLVASSGPIVAVVDGVLITSEDGSSWTAMPDPAGSLGPGPRVGSVVSWGDGGLLASGTLLADKRGALWSSVDGRAWTAVPDQPALAIDPRLDEGFLGGRLFRLHDGYLLVGDRSRVGSGVMAAWRSSDGLAWRQERSIDGSSEAPPPLFALADVVALPELDIGVVRSSDDEGRSSERLVVSDDGVDWVDANPPVGVAGPRLGRSLAASGGRALLLATETTGRVRAWWGTPTGTAAVTRVPEPGSGSGRSPAASMSPAAPDLAWQRLEPSDAKLFGSAGTTEITSVARWDDGVLAVGSTTRELGEEADWATSFTGEAWLSPDGIRWLRAPSQRSLDDALVRDLATSDSVAVAVGSDGRELTDGRGTAASWRSTDGLHWTRSPTQASLRGAVLEGVTSTPAGFLAVGRFTESGTDEEMPLVTKPMAWWSLDGLRWTRATNVEAEFDEPNGWWQSGMRAVAAGGPGYVAVGWGTQHGIVWSSTDGQTWSIVPAARNLSEALGPGPGGTEGEGGLTDVVAYPGGVVAVGEVGINIEEGAVFTSGDGLRWRRAPLPDAVRGSYLTGVASTPAGFVIAGGAPGVARPAFFVSRNTATWAAADPVALEAAHAGVTEAPAVARDVVGYGDWIVAVGTEDGDGAVWLATPPDALVPGRACPTGELTLAVLDAMAARDRVACFGDVTLRFRAWLSWTEGGEMGAAANLATRPRGVPSALRHVVPKDRTGLREGWVRVTGHFADPSCDMEQRRPDLVPFIPPAIGRLECEQLFRVTDLVPDS